MYIIRFFIIPNLCIEHCQAPKDECVTRHTHAPSKYLYTFLLFTSYLAIKNLF